MTLTYLLWQAGASGPLTPGTAEQLNARSLPRVASLTELGAVDDTGYSAQAAINAIMVIVEGNGTWKWVAGTSVVSDGVIASLTGNRWVREPLGVFGAKALMVNPAHPFALTNNSDRGLPFEKLWDAEDVLPTGGVVLVAPGTYTGDTIHKSLSLAKSSTWQGLGPVKVTNGAGATFTTTISADGVTIQVTNFEFELNMVAPNAHVHAFAVDAFDGGGELTFNACYFNTNNSSTGRPFRMRMAETSAYCNAVFNDCEFESAASLGFSLEIFAGTPGTGRLEFNRCTFQDPPKFEATNHTVVLNQCQTNGQITAYGTLEINGGQVNSGSNPGVTSTASKTLNLIARHVDFKSNAAGGEFLTLGAGSTFTAELQGAYPTGSAKKVNSGITTTYVPATGQVQTIQIELNGPTALTTSDKRYFRIPSTLNGAILISVAAMCQTASSSGVPTFTVKKGATNMLSTNLTIDASETDSSTAATPAVIDSAQATVATGNQIEVACTVAGTGTKFTVIELQFRLP